MNAAIDKLSTSVFLLSIARRKSLTKVSLNEETRLENGNRSEHLHAEALQQYMD